MPSLKGYYKSGQSAKELIDVLSDGDEDLDESLLDELPRVTKYKDVPKILKHLDEKEAHSKLRALRQSKAKE